MDEEKTSKLSLSHALSVGWQGMKKNFGSLLLFGVIVVIVQFLLGLSGLLDDGMGQLIIQGVIDLIGGLVVTPLMTVAGIAIALAIVRSQEVSWQTFTEKAFTWWKVLIASILYAIIVFLGFVLLVIPGVYFGVKYSQALYILVDQPGTGIWDAFKKSAQLTDGARWKLFGFWFVQGGVILLGILALGVGVIVSIMVLLVAQGAIYLLLKKNTASLSDDNVEESNELDREGAVPEEVNAFSNDTQEIASSATLLDSAPKGKSWVAGLFGVLGGLMLVLFIAVPIVLLSLTTMRGSSIDAMYESQMRMIELEMEEQMQMQEGNIIE